MLGLILDPGNITVKKKPKNNLNSLVSYSYRRKKDNTPISKIHCRSDGDTPSPTTSHPYPQPKATSISIFFHVRGPNLSPTGSLILPIFIYNISY